MKAGHRRAYQVTMTIYVTQEATIPDLKSLIGDLSWVGGCRDRDHDPMFSSASIQNLNIKRAKEFDR